MFRFKEGDRVVATVFDPRGRAGQTGVVVAVEADEELRDVSYVVRFDDGQQGLLDEGWLGPWDKPMGCQPGQGR